MNQKLHSEYYTLPFHIYSARSFAVHNYNTFSLQCFNVESCLSCKSYLSIVVECTPTPCSPGPVCDGQAGEKPFIQGEQVLCNVSLYTL